MILFTLLNAIHVLSFPIDTCVQSEGLERRAPINLFGPCIIATAALISSSNAFIPQQHLLANQMIKTNVFPDSHDVSLTSDLARDVSDRTWELYQNHMKLDDIFKAKANAVNEVSREFCLDWEKRNEVEEWLDAHIMQNQWHKKSELNRLDSLKRAVTPLPKPIQRFDAFAGLHDEMNEFMPKKNADLYKPPPRVITPPSLAPVNPSTVLKEDISENQQATTPKSSCTWLLCLKAMFLILSS